jgi:hypothetical protein
VTSYLLNYFEDIALPDPVNDLTAQLSEAAFLGVFIIMRGRGG